MRRSKLLVGLAGLAVVVAAGVVVLWPQPQPSSRITRENFDRIKIGMSRTEVEAILGPPGDYTTRPTINGGRLHGRETERGSPVWWASDEFTLAVVFTRRDKVVTGVYAWKAERFEQSALADLRWHIERQWRRWFPE